MRCLHELRQCRISQTPVSIQQRRPMVSRCFANDTQQPGLATEPELRSQIMELEQQAAEAHREAQRLNKLGQFEDATKKYAEMRALDAEALRLTNLGGCPSCRQPHAAAQACSTASLQSTAMYVELQVAKAWPQQQTASAGPSVEERARAAILCSAVADAAAMGVQWVYDTSRLEKLLQERGAAVSPGPGLEFMEPPCSPFLPQYASGRHSPYGEGTLVLLRSLAQQRGLHCNEYAVLCEQFFGESFDGYRNASITGFLRNRAKGALPPACGAEDQQADCVARLGPLVALYAGDVSLMEVVEAATRVTQNTDEAVAWACAGAAVLERVLLGATAAAAVQDTVDELRGSRTAGRLPLCSPQLAEQLAGHLQQALELSAEPHLEVVAQLGRNCHMPNACQTPLHVVLHHERRYHHHQQQQQQLEGGPHANGGGGSSEEGVFVGAIRDALRAGGCSASRAGFAGALLGALLGPSCLPAAWSSKCTSFSEVQDLAGRLCSFRREAAGL